MDYFEKKNLTQSASMFIEETEKAKNQQKDFNVIMETLKSGNHQQFLQIWEPKFEEISLSLENNFNRDFTEDSLLILDLKLHFWFLSYEVKQSNDNKVSHEMKSFFANYLSKKGDKISGIPVLSKYFAIPYISTPSSNSIFVESFSEDWFSEICSQLGSILLTTSPKKSIPTKLETCIANFSKFQSSIDPVCEKSQSSGEVKFLGRDHKKIIIKSTENRKVLDMLSRRESISVGRADLSEFQSSSISEAVETRRKMLEYKLLLKQKEHHMRMKHWESKECLEQSHKKWIYFVK